MANPIQTGATRNRTTGKPHGFQCREHCFEGVSSTAGTRTPERIRSHMTNSPFPPEVPKVGDLLRVTPVKVDYVVHHYKDFCEEAHVVSRFYATDYEGNPIIEVTIGGKMMSEPLRFYPQKQMCLCFFDGHDRIVNVEVILE